MTALIIYFSRTATFLHQSFYVLYIRIIVLKNDVSNFNYLTIFSREGKLVHNFTATILDKRDIEPEWVEAFLNYVLWRKESVDLYDASQIQSKLDFICRNFTTSEFKLEAYFLLQYCRTHLQTTYRQIMLERDLDLNKTLWFYAKCHL